MDECYTYYGIWHESFGEFYTSMLTGINFSPPLYFFLNFIFQLFLPTSIELLRIQSLIWVLIGITISFLLTRKLFGSFSAFLATILVASQSNLLISQSLEARHYSMFFACGALVLYMQMKSSIEQKKLKNKLLVFTSNLFLCQVHYLGIIFSGSAGLAYLISSKRKSLPKRIPFEIWLAWITAVPFLLFFLSRQESVLNYWPKPNGVNDLINTFNESFIWLCVLIPLIIALITRNHQSINVIDREKSSSTNNLVIITAILWVTNPIIVWALSQISNLNLFVDRYFIPKEIGVVVLLGSVINFLIGKIKIRNTGLVYLSTLVFCIFCIGLNLKRFAHVLNPEHNYHHKLISEITFSTENTEPVVYKDDPSYFPNAYLDGKKCVIEIENKSYLRIYQAFSKKINVQ